MTLSLSFGAVPLHAEEGEDRPADDTRLLAVGPGSIIADENGSWIAILGQSVTIGIETEFPRGSVAAGDYVAVEGTLGDDGPGNAVRIVNLGGEYVIGSSPVYLAGRISEVDAAGRASIGSASVDLAQAYVDPALLDLSSGDTVEVIGFEAPGDAASTTIVASEATSLTASSVLGIHGSGMRGIHGSGMRGIHGSGMRGIHGSGMRGIHGSGMRGIHGSGMRGINGSGMRGIHGSGMRGIHGSGMRGIHGSGMRGIHGSGARATNQSVGG